MSTLATYQTATATPEATERLGECLGAALKGGEVIELVSDLGGGKTTFVRGLARGFGSPDKVASPTFTLSRIYRTDGRAMHHLDFYRLHEPGLMSEELADILSNPKDIVVIEWADIVQDVLPKERLTITVGLLADEGRQFTLRAPASLAYLLEAVRAC